MRKRACDACHRRKIQCDQQLPQCDWCKHHGMACTFDRVARVRARQRTESPAAAGPSDARSSKSPSVSSLSWTGTGTPPARPTPTPTPASAPPGPGPGPGPGLGSVAGVCFGKLHFAGTYLGDISSYNGLTFFSPAGLQWIASRAGQEGVFPVLGGDVPPWHSHHQERSQFLSTFGPLQAQGPTPDLSLPDRHVVEEYLRFFRQSHFRLEFPVVDSILFQNTIKVAYEPWTGPPSLDPVTAKASIFAFLAVISMFEGECRPSVPPVDGHGFAIKVQHMLALCSHELNLTVLQTVLMLAIYELFSGQVPSAAMLLSLACRVMFMLGGHVMLDPESSTQEWTGTPQPCLQAKRHLRQLFWLCYTLDKEISLRTLQPPSIDDDHCDLTLPAGYLESQYIDKHRFADVGSLDETAVPILPGDLRLNIIKSKVCRLLYSAAAFRKTDAELLRDIRELDDELEKWRLSIPETIRPVLSIWKGTTCSGGFKPEGPESIRTIVINFEYHYLLASIHRATGRCLAWGKEPCCEMDGVSSSLTLSVEASRSTLLYLRSAIHAILGEAFWLIVFYPMCAITTIFCWVLFNPLDPRAEGDLELLRSAPELIKNIRLRRLTPNEMLHLRMVDDFLAELLRLATSAVMRARQQQRQRQQQLLQQPPASQYSPNMGPP